MQHLMVVLVANGRLDDFLVLHIPKHAVLVGIDRGALWLLERGFFPTVAIGDFDSVTESEMATIQTHVSQIHMHPRKKDATDMELAFLWAVQQKPAEIRIFGGVGSRFDHSWATIQLLEKYRKFRIRIILYDTHNRMEMVYREQHLIRTDKYSYYSILPISRRAVVSLRGFAYPLTKGVFQRGSTLGVSNELIAPIGTVTVHEGRVWLIASHD